MNRLLLLTFIMSITVGDPCEALRPADPNDHYVGNREPLLRGAFVPLPLGSIKPAGWLRDQLEVQARGLTGHIEEFWPDLGPNSGWKGGDGESWERGPYYLDGLVPLAYLLEDKELERKAQVWIEWILNSGREDGWFGPEKNKDRWPLAVALKVLTQYHEATGDDRVIDLLTRYFDYLKEAPGRREEDSEWFRVRAMETVLSVYWLYNRTGDEDLLGVADKIFENSYDWVDWAHHFRFTGDVMAMAPGKSHWAHNVNIAMAFKFPGLRHLRSKDPYHFEAVQKAFENIDAHHGQANGMYGGDEHLSGKHPSQGIELCGVVESMFSLERLIADTGYHFLGDRLERIAFNALPGTFTPDFWAHQYDQQANQVLCTVAKRNWSSNGNHANIFGLEPNYGCCTANLHQGWPKLVSHLWMATPGNGLAAVAYGPCVVEATVGNGVRIKMAVETDYPFKDTISIVMDPEKRVRFLLTLRIPSWAEEAEARIGDEILSATPGTSYLSIGREWSAGDRVEVRFPMKVRTETRYNDSVAILRGPLVYSLKIGEHFHQIAGERPHADWEVYPTTDWNYGLLLDREAPEKSFEVEESAIGETPFAGEETPVRIWARGKRIPFWSMKDNSADAPPKGLIGVESPIEELELVPYGCARLRITEFPLVLE